MQGAFNSLLDIIDNTKDIISSKVFGKNKVENTTNILDNIKTLRTLE